MFSVRSATRPQGSTLNVIGLLLAGGASTRFGSDKALATINGVSLTDFVLDALRPAVDSVTFVGGPKSWAIDRGCGHVDDGTERRGPLNALAVALSSLDLEAEDVVVVVPCDTPLLGTPTLRRLVEVARTNGGAVARSGVESHWSVSAWNALALARACATGIKEGVSALHLVMGRLAPAFVEVDGDEVLNVNTPDDLSRATRILAH